MSTTLPACCYRLSVKALITDEAGRFLICKEEIGRWDLPGGGLEHGEEPLAGLTRELQEEMGLSPTWMAEKPSHIVSFENGQGQPSINLVYPTRVSHLNFTPSDECIEVRFVTASEASQLEGVYGNVLQLAELLKKKPI